MTDESTKPLTELSEDELRSLIDRARHEERRTRDAGRRQEWEQFRHDAEAELARRGHAHDRPARGET
jgi:hypothetical protein